MFVALMKSVFLSHSPYSLPLSTSPSSSVFLSLFLPLFPHLYFSPSFYLSFLICISLPLSTSLSSSIFPSLFLHLFPHLYSSQMLHSSQFNSSQFKLISIKIYCISGSTYRLLCLLHPSSSYWKVTATIAFFSQMLWLLKPEEARW